MMIEFPNGEKHYFQNLQVRFADNTNQIPELWEEKLTGIEDQFGNFMTIDYKDTNGDKLFDDEWVIKDSVGRAHYVFFSSLVTGYQKVITSISLEGFGGTH